MDKKFFPLRPEAQPKIYAYEDRDPESSGLLKVGYTTQPVKKRVKQQYPEKIEGGTNRYHIVFEQSAMYSDGDNFSGHDVYRALKKRGYRLKGREWFRCTVDELMATYIVVRDRVENAKNRARDFKTRPEHKEAVRKTIEHYQSAEKENIARAAKFIWNAKMRFGKTFAAYQLAKVWG